jgi:hypothetical protein
MYEYFPFLLFKPTTTILYTGVVFFCVALPPIDVDLPYTPGDTDRVKWGKYSGRFEVRSAVQAEMQQQKKKKKKENTQQCDDTTL